MSIPRGKFIPVSAVRINRNGTVDVKVSGATARKLQNPKPKRRNVAAGFYDEDGYFHPIRASYDYNAGRVGEKGKAKKRKPATKKRAAKKAKAKRKR